MRRCEKVAPTICTRCPAHPRAGSAAGIPCPAADPGVVVDEQADSCRTKFAQAVSRACDVRREQAVLRDPGRLSMAIWPARVRPAAGLANLEAARADDGTVVAVLNELAIGR